MPSASIRKRVTEGWRLRAQGFFQRGRTPSVERQGPNRLSTDSSETFPPPACSSETGSLGSQTGIRIRFHEAPRAARTRPAGREPYDSSTAWRTRVGPAKADVEATIELCWFSVKGKAGASR
jgi:hypothetical protein